MLKLIIKFIAILKAEIFMQSKEIEKIFKITKKAKKKKNVNSF